MKQELILLPNEKVICLRRSEVNLFVRKYAGNKVKNWSDKIGRLSKFAKSQPQVAYAAFIHERLYKYISFMQAIPQMNISNH